jgi:hypothetical protein
VNYEYTVKKSLSSKKDPFARKPHEAGARCARKHKESTQRSAVPDVAFLCDLSATLASFAVKGFRIRKAREETL